MRKISAYRKSILFITPVFWLLAVVGLVLCLLYSNREWNASQFETFYARWDFYWAYLIEGIGIMVLYVVLLICSQKPGSKISDLFSIILSSLLCAGCLAVIITLAVNCVGINRVIKDYNLDCQLKSDDTKLFHEAVDSLISKKFKEGDYTPYFAEPNEYIVKAARDDYPKAQNSMGCFYYGRARNALSQAGNYGNYDDNMTKQSETDFDHAVYWFLKAARNRYGKAQTNLGRIFMGDLTSNRIPDNELAKYWLISATRNGEIEAYYYLGKVYSAENLHDAYICWSKGAKLGSEDCARELEMPEFALGCPPDNQMIEAPVADTVIID